MTDSEYVSMIPLLEMKEIHPEAYEKRIKREGIVNAWVR